MVDRMAKKKYLLVKCGQTLFTIFIVLTLNFFLFRVMPGDPARTLIHNPRISPEIIANLEKVFGLDKPLYMQYLYYLKNMITGNMGMSFAFRRPVADIIAEKMGNTILLVGVATVLSIVIGVIIGIIAAYKRGSRIDISALAFSLFMWAMPAFWLGIIMIIVFSIYFRAFPTSGITIPGYSHNSFFDLAKDVAHHMFLPTITLALVLLGEYFLIMRNTLIDVLTEDFIMTARAKGLSDARILQKHALKNALLPMVTIIAISLGFIVAGAIEVETVFSWPGLGRLIYEALRNRDYPILEGVFAIVSICVIIANFASDLLYAYIDPRVKT
jgi:peptide/nickel transport system permease protein